LELQLGGGSSAVGGAGLYLRPRDMAKIDQLGTLDYGYLWWVGRAGGRDVVLAWGHGGQYTYVVPSLEVVVVTTATWQRLGTGAGPQMAAIADLISNRIVPAVVPTES
jgi:CubicO group peptidase (beta-lactamase class C family)